MNNPGYVPLWRKSLNNKIRQRDPTAWRVFETLLLVVDYDTGIWEGGRFQLIGLDGSGIKPSTLYSALKRLEKAKMITLTGNTRYSIISICKWEDYKVSGNTKRQQRGNTSGNTSGNTLKRREEEKNIEIDTNVSSSTNADVKELFSELVGLLGFTDAVRYTDGRRRKLQARIRSSSPTDLRKAAEAIANDAYMQGDNQSGRRYGDIDYLIRSDEQVDKWIQRSENKLKDLKEYI